MQPPPQFEAQHVDGRHSNWIDGAARATTGGLYELWSRNGSGRRLGEWPRSDARDVERALTALTAAPVRGRTLDGEAAWKALGSESEHAAIAAVLGWSTYDPSWVTEGGLAPEPNRDLALRSPAFLDHGDPLESRIGALAVFLPGRLLSPNEVFQGLERLLATGANVLVVAAEENPLPAELAVRAASAQLAAGKAQGPVPLALIHAPTTAGWQALLAHPDLRLVIGNRHGGVATETAQALMHKAPHTEAQLVLIPSMEAVHVWGPELTLKRPEVDVRPDFGALEDTVKRAAVDLFQTRSLGGLRHQNAGVIHVPSAIYSDVIELFRDALSGCAGFPTWPGGALPELYEAAWRGAVDGGASLLCGGHVERTRHGPVLQPTLLVNVAPHSPWARPGLPLAQIRLVRVVE